MYIRTVQATYFPHSEVVCLQVNIAPVAYIDDVNDSDIFINGGNYPVVSHSPPPQARLVCDESLTAHVRIV